MCAREGLRGDFFGGVRCFWRRRLDVGRDGGVVGWSHAPGEYGDMGSVWRGTGDGGAWVKGHCEVGVVGEAMVCASDISRDITYECLRSG
jgi:hypothetical protein